ncbi:hypothetical protein K490DRAFT_60129 [Saccharata proteae CBS 121410]|uniref:Uncharacterized protein n=1 Tax=Saccharata proteae CBS 121410 TaxID=1314787 RepID=A0A9P4LTJ1_9PEZI|nr:hypothetical protein K490DRAFT_60129 [Saccharata proteae CBS 121410]
MMLLLLLLLLLWRLLMLVLVLVMLLLAAVAAAVVVCVAATLGEGASDKEIAAPSFVACWANSALALPRSCSYGVVLMKSRRSALEERGVEVATAMRLDDGLGKAAHAIGGHFFRFLYFHLHRAGRRAGSHQMPMPNDDCRLQWLSP